MTAAAQQLAGPLLAFVVYLCIFVPLESLLPLRSPPGTRWRRTDLLHFLLSGLLRQAALAVVLVPAIWLLGYLTHPGTQAFIRSLPGAAQFALAVLVQEVGAYWGHRLAHTVPALWRFHAVHHSSEHLDWLAAARVHPLDQAFIRTCGFVPLYLLGFSKETFGLFLVIESAWAVFIHANVRVRLGWLEQLVSTPAFHHWHHTHDHPSVYDKNYAGLLPVVDRVFGTFYLPPDRMPASYGVTEPVSDGYLGQLAHPFRRPAAPAGKT